MDTLSRKHQLKYVVELDLAEGFGLVVGWGRLAEGPGVDWWIVDISSTSEMDADGNGRVDCDDVDVEGILPAHRVL